MSLGGPLKQLSIGGIGMAVKNGAEVSLVAGGYDNEPDMNGDGSMDVIQEAVPCKGEGIEVSFRSDADRAAVVQMKNSGLEYPAVATLANGDEYTASVAIIGAVAINTKRAAMALNLAGGGDWQKQN